MRRLGLVVTLLVLLLPAAAQAGEPPNQNDPCSRGGRDACGTTGVGTYETYRYGTRWFGDYRGAIGGVSGPTFCIDLRYWYPGKDYGYEPRSAAGGIKNRDGGNVSAGDLRKMSYAVFNYGRSESVDKQAAVMLYVHQLMGDGAVGEVDPSAPGVTGTFNQISRRSARLAGPYQVDVTVPDGLVVGAATELTVKVTAASGAAMKRTRVQLSGSGADDLPDSVRTGANGTARVPFTPATAKNDLRITATAADLAAPVPDLYVPTRGKSARNGQRLVAPAAKDYSATLNEAVEPVELTVTTQATPTAVVVGSETSDTVTITGPGTTWRGDAEVRLFGPFETEAAITCAGEPVSIVDYEARAGETTTPPVKLDALGFYAYQIVIATTPDVVGVTTPCPDPTEIVRAQAQPRVVTQVSAPVIEPGASITDTLRVTGLAGQPASIDAALYGPFGAPEKLNCDGAPVWTGLLDVPGDGEYVTEPATLPTPGYYTYREAVRERPFVQPFVTACADAAETTIVRGHPAITTQVSEATVVPGAKLSDTAVVTGLGELDAPVKVELWGPYDSKAAITCQGEPFWAGEVTAEGDGEYKTDAVTIDRAGYYTYREAILATNAFDGVQTECGEAAETSFAKATPLVTTLVSKDAVKPGQTIRDRIRVSGLGKTPARVSVDLYGPFASRAAMDCSGGPFKSSSVRVEGDGVVQSEPMTVGKVGFYTFVERIEDGPGIQGTKTACGEEAETSLGRPLILTGRGDDVRDVYGEAAQGDNRAAPTRVHVPRLGVDAPVSPIAIDLDAGALGISQNIDRVGWWRDGAAPGDDKGATLLAGHVDSAARGAGAFYPLKNARKGDTVRLEIEGGATKGYRVVKIQRTQKENLPPRIYSRKGKARLVLVTCGGPFNSAAGHYRDNIIVTAVPR